MAMKSCLLPHLPWQPKLMEGEFFFVGKKGKVAVCRALKFKARSGLPVGMDMAGVAKVDLDGAWILSEYWEAADGKTGAGYGGDTYTFLAEDTKPDADFFTF